MDCSNIRFSFVILNYNSANETINCIQSILNITYENKFIIVVDNDSKDQAPFFDLIKSRFKDNKKIICLKSYRNIGYARGNNIGIDYARKELNSDFVCVINPDTTVESEDFIEKSICEYYNLDYAICGPRILNEMNKNINPLGGYHDNPFYWVKEIVSCIRIYYTKKYYLSKINIFKKKTAFVAKENDSDICVSSMVIPEDSNDMLSGACLIFSPSFFSLCNGYCDKTFLYDEEIFLKYACVGLGLKLFYYPDIEIKHIGGQSVPYSKEETRLRMMFVQKELAKSAFELLKVMLRRNNKRTYKQLLNPKIDSYQVI